ncbi:MAG: FMN-binding negative transcriptional regulator [Rufibacter sp.]
MYIPPHYRQEDLEKQLAFMRQYPFATLVSQKEGRPFASHLPFVTEVVDGQVLLLSHMARNNPQWQDLQDQEVLVIFQEPHAYISPTLYNKTLNVPTWNYTAVHAYGALQTVEEPQAVFALLEKMMQTYEPAYQAQWQQLPGHYKEGMARGIVAFEIVVTEIQAKEKLSQNRTIEERVRISESLKESKDSAVAALGHLMESTF